MARARKALPAQIDVAHLISAGVLASVCPRALIEDVLAQTGKASQRERLLPAPAVVAAGIAPYGRSEIAMATELLPAKLKPDMLVVADRSFYSFTLWQATCATGARLAWRVKFTLGLPVEQLLSDGS